MTANILLIHFEIFILVMCLTLLQLKIKGLDKKVTLSSYFILAAAAPILNIILLFILIYEFIIIFLDWRRR